MSEKELFNHLRDEKSLYLSQHKSNPINWYPYGPIALEKAQSENKPIFLSIGYSACHWCHVMAKETFEDPKVAEFLNEHFISIKVDREELPDVDSYYQLACQVTNGRGGWPLNAFLTSDMKPYFVGTYFPIVGDKNIPGFMDLVTNLHKAYTDENDTVQTNANQVIEAITQPPKYEQKIEFEGHYPGAAAVMNALKNYQDNDWGGYGTEPKFTHYAFLEWAIEHMLEGMIPKEFGDHVVKTIEMMLMGGINDHARGGVHRYAVDQAWKVPHFEKMLYDQAGLLKLLSKASLLFPSPLVFDSIIQTLDYLKHEMLSEENFFFSGQDSDSEEVEGLYFTFSKEEFVESIIHFDAELEKDMDKILKWFDISEKGNFENNLNIIALNPQHKAEYFTPDGWTQMRKVRQALFTARKMRMPPMTDSKGVAGWNFQMATALLETIQYSKIEAIKNSAQDLFTTVHESLITTFMYTDEENKNRIHTTTTRTGHVPLFEDYIFFAEFSLKSYELYGEENFRLNGLEALKFTINEFYKDGFFFTRAIAYDDTEQYQNLHTSIFDQSYKAPLATMISLLRKWSLVDIDIKESLEKLESSIDSLTHLSLQNPLAFGETLRALVYPDEAYRKVEVPKAWIKQGRFQQFLINFSHRFALTYHEREDDKWQICTATECEVQGSGHDEFTSIFKAAPQDDKE